MKTTRNSGKTSPSSFFGLTCWTLKRCSSMFLYHKHMESGKKWSSNAEPRRPVFQVGRSYLMPKHMKFDALSAFKQVDFGRLLGY